jgi:hypothetical protein
LRAHLECKEFDEGEAMKTRYQVHRIDVKMKRDQAKFELFLNSLKGEVVSVIPNVSPSWTFGGMGAGVHHLWVIEKIKEK